MAKWFGKSKNNTLDQHFEGIERRLGRTNDLALDAYRLAENVLSRSIRQENVMNRIEDELVALRKTVDQMTAENKIAEQAATDYKYASKAIRPDFV